MYLLLIQELLMLFEVVLTYGVIVIRNRSYIIIMNSTEVEFTPQLHLYWDLREMLLIGLCELLQELLRQFRLQEEPSIMVPLVGALRLGPIIR